MKRNDLWIGSVDHIMNIISDFIIPLGYNDTYWDINQLMTTFYKYDTEKVGYKKQDFITAMKQFANQDRVSIHFINGTVYYKFK